MIVLEMLGVTCGILGADEVAVIGAEMREPFSGTFLRFWALLSLVFFALGIGTKVLQVQRVHVPECSGI